jgi:quercetin dioxygenase-like cupin family protein
MTDYYDIDNSIAKETYQGLSVSKIKNTFGAECLLILLEKGSEFPEHLSPKDANLFVVEGQLSMFINEGEYLLNKQEWFRFPKEVPHRLVAVENSKFLIIR